MTGARPRSTPRPVDGGHAEDVAGARRPGGPGRRRGRGWGASGRERTRAILRVGPADAGRVGSGRLSPKGSARSGAGGGGPARRADGAGLGRGGAEGAAQREAAEGRLPAHDDPDAFALLASGAHRHGDEVHAEAHAHPHVAATDDGRPVLGIVGAGAVGTALGVAFHRAGLARRRRVEPRRRPSRAASSRSCPAPGPSRTPRDRRRVPPRPRRRPGRRGRRRRRRPPALQRARRSSTRAASSAPTRSGPRSPRARRPAASTRSSRSPTSSAPSKRSTARRSRSRRPGRSRACSSRWPSRSAACPWRCRPGPSPPTTPRRSSRQRASSRCSTRSRSWAASPGWTRRSALAVYGPLLQGTLDNARSLGIAAALTGPMTRGDVGTLEAHAAALAAQAPSVSPLHRELTLRAIGIAADRGSIDAAAAARLRAAVDAAGRMPARHGGRPHAPGLSRIRPCATASPRGSPPDPSPASSGRRPAAASATSGSGVRTPSGRPGACPRSSTAQSSRPSDACDASERRRSQAGRSGRAVAIGPAVRIRWTRPTSPAPGVRSGVASAPWRG